MRFEDELYVRLYKRDTTTWKMLPWQARCILPLILRKVDRAGVLELGDDGLEALAIHIDVPMEIVEAGVPALIKRNVLVLGDDGRLEWPRYREGQTAKYSDKARQRAQRERRRVDVTPRDADSTPGDGGVTPRDEVSLREKKRREKKRREEESDAHARVPAPPLRVVRGAKSEKRTRCPASDASQADVAAWAARWEIPHEHAQFPRFVDHHRSAKPVSFDWSAEWRTWIGDPRFAPRAGRKAKDHVQPSDGTYGKEIDW